MTGEAGARRFDPPRPVEVWHHGEWVPAWQDRWVRQDDGSWKASVTYVVRYEWGPGKHLRTVPADQVRPAPEHPRAAPSGPAAPPTTGRV